MKKCDYYRLLDYSFDEMRFSSQVDIMDPIVCASSAKIQLHVSTGLHEMSIPDDVVSTSPERPYRIEYDPSLGDNGFDRRVISDVENEKPHVVAEFELPLDFF